MPVTGLPKPIRALLRVAVLVLAMIAAGLVALGYGIAKAQGHGDHGHGWYERLKTPQGYSCCRADLPGRPGDCRPVQARPRDDGSWEAFFGGRWHVVPPDRILPDHLNRIPLHAHICEQDGYVRCFLRGGGGT